MTAYQLLGLWVDAHGRPSKLKMRQALYVGLIFRELLQNVALIIIEIYISKNNKNLLGNNRETAFQIGTGIGQF